MNQRKAKHAKARVLNVQRTTVGIPEDVHIAALAKAECAAQDLQDRLVSVAVEKRNLSDAYRRSLAECTRLSVAHAAIKRERDEARAVNNSRLLHTRTFFVLGALAGIALTNLIYLAIQAA